MDKREKEVAAFPLSCSFVRAVMAPGSSVCLEARPGTVGPSLSGTQARTVRDVVRYGPRSALGAVIVDSLLRVDAASHGPAGRCVRLCPTR